MGGQVNFLAQLKDGSTPVNAELVTPALNDMVLEPFDNERIGNIEFIDKENFHVRLVNSRFQIIPLHQLHMAGKGVVNCWWWQR